MASAQRTDLAKAGVCPPAPQVTRIIMPAIKDVRCGLSRFTTVQHAPESRGEHSMECVRGAMRDRGDLTV